jgi:hypothetical protein
MGRAHFFRSAADYAGNVLPNVQVGVYKAGSSQLIDQTLYTQSVGSTTLSNPFVTSTGIIDFYLDDPQSVKIELIQGSNQSTIDNLEVTPPPENLVQSTTGFTITNDPTVDQFLQCTAPGTAAWVAADDLISTQASPLSTLRSYDFSGSSLGDLTAQDPTGASVTPTYVDVTGDTLPSGYTFTKALRVPITTPVVLRVPPLPFPETGTLIFAYKIVGASTGVGVPTARASVDSGLIQVPMPNDPALLNQWNVGYVGDIPTGTHSLRLEQIPGTDTAAYVLFGSILVQYGNNIPFHTHGGVGAESTVLGPDAAADYARSTILGGSAEAMGVDATAVGFNATADVQGTAFGAYSYANASGTAVGYYATTAAGTSGGVSVGYQAQTLADNGVAIGQQASAEGARSVAVGPTAAAEGADSLALGSGSEALASGSIAVGAGAVVDAGHTNSVALGPGAVTTAADQAVIGTSATTVVVPGDLTSQSDVALAGADATLGFFGQPGTVRPTVTGSRGGNASLAALLAALDDLGLIVDGSTS